MKTLISLSSATGYGYVLLNTGDSDELHNAVQRILGDGLVNEHDYHVTLMYDKSNPQMPSIPEAMYFAKPIGAELFGPDNDTLVLTLSCPELVERHKFLLRNGFTHSYPEFNPHITIKLNADAHDLEKLREAVKHVDYLPKKLRLSNESWEPINEDWKPQTDS